MTLVNQDMFYFCNVGSGTSGNVSRRTLAPFLVSFAFRIDARKVHVCTSDRKHCTLGSSGLPQSIIFLDAQA